MTSSSSHHPESCAEFLWSAAVCWGQQWRHSEVSGPCQPCRVSRSSPPELILVRQLAINRMWNYPGENNPLFAGEWRASKGKANLPRIFPCDAAALPVQGQQGGSSSCSSTIAPPALCPILPGEGLTQTGWLATWRAQMGEWQPPPAAVEPCLWMLFTLTSHSVLLCLCIRAIVAFPFPLHWHTYSQQSCKFENHVPTVTSATLMMWSRVINQISDLALCYFPRNAQDTACWVEKWWSFFLNSFCWLWAA